MAKAAMITLRVYYSLQRFFHAAVPVGCLLSLSLALILTGCVSWTHPTKPSTAFADDAAACEAEAAQEDPHRVGKAGGQNGQTETARFLRRYLRVTKLF